MRQVEEQIGKTPLGLIPPVDFPEDLGHLWLAFLELADPDGLSYSEIKSWSELTGNKLLPWEVEVIKRLDRKYRKVVNG